MATPQDISKPATTPEVAAGRKPVKARSAPPVPRIMKQGPLIPWLYLLPALLVMSFFIVYPMVNTVVLSFRNRDGTASAATTCVEGRPCWGVFENYRYALTAEFNTSSPGALWSSFWSSSYGNTIKWIVVMVFGTVSIGLGFAVLADRVKYEALAKSILFMPMAISFVGAGVIWKFVYDYGTSQTQVGLLNAIITSLGGDPVAWLSTS
jgi:alpha-glucoside transport system permease protein